MIEAIIVFLIAAPTVVLWGLEMPLAVRFANPVVTALSIGRLSGLLGAALFILTIFLSTRPKFLEKSFGGLSKIYNFHHHLGIATVILLLLHPASVAMAQPSVTITKVANYFDTIENIPIQLGEAALGIMIVLIALTLFFRPNYKNWKITHKFMGLALGIAVIHMFTVGSDISQFTPLKIYMFALAVVGLTSALYQVVFSKSLRKKYKYTVKSVKSIGQVVEVTMSPVKESLSYDDGQFIFVEFSDEYVTGESHPFSIAPGAGKDIRIIVKEEGDYTGKLKTLKKGTEVLVEGPYGRFSKMVRKTGKQIWLGGGVGIVPFLSMAKNSGTHKTPIDLYYLVGNKKEALYLDELNGYAKINKNLRIVPYYSEERGHITVDVIEKLSGGIAAAEYFICGPKGMTVSVSRELIKKGVSPKYIHSELFEY